jgi:hypothetical protein
MRTITAIGVAEAVVAELVVEWTWKTRRPWRLKWRLDGR